MKPKKLLISTLEEHLAPAMKEQGFKFLRSKMIGFKRTHKGFVQEIDFFSSYHNREDYCQFQCMYGVSSKEFEKWQKATGVHPMSEGRLCGGPEDGIPDWPKGQGTIIRTKGSPRSFRLLNNEKDALTIPVLVEAISKTTVAHLDRMSSYEAILEAKHPSARDMLITRCPVRAEIMAMLGRREEAERALREWIEFKKGHGGHTDNEEEVYEILFGRSVPSS